MMLRSRSVILRCLPIVAAIAIASGCSAPTRVSDPVGELHNAENASRIHLAAMRQYDGVEPTEAYLEALHGVVWRPGYTVDVRLAAAERLRDYELEELKRTLRQRLPRMNAWQGKTALCEMIAAEGWTDLSPALVSSWAEPVLTVEDDERPEYLALVQLHGRENVGDVVYEMLLSSNKVWQQGLRTRCWNLLHRLGYRERLIELLADAELPDDDAFLQDLRAGARDLGLVPHNREEILWMRELRKPERADFWAEAKEAIWKLPDDRRLALEIRDLPVVVSVARHEPELLTMSTEAMYERLASHLRGRKHHSHGSNFNDFNPGNSRERLHDVRGELTWGDLAAMLMAVRALQIPQVVDHLFDYAQRDRRDETTEYGGVISLDRKGRFEILEFPPRIRHHDRKFIASQAMLDAGYTSLFHFHMHVQDTRNTDYAGPGYGDTLYADNTRANCLVFTSVARGRMNVDYYRHGRVSVDLGEVQLP